MPIQPFISRTELAAGDRPAMAEILRRVGVFSETEINVGLELVDETLERGLSSDYHWNVVEQVGRIVGFACHGPVPMTEGTFDLYWLAVHPDCQGQGLATILEHSVVERLKLQKARWLLVETPATSPFEPARRFYESRGYQFLCRIPDFYRPGADRLALGKRLDEESRVERRVGQ